MTTSTSSEDIDTVLRQEELVRSLAAQHKLDISSRRNSKRKRPTLPLVVENREIEQTVKNFYRKLRKVNQPAVHNLETLLPSLMSLCASRGRFR